MTTRNVHLAGYVRTLEEQRLVCVFNFNPQSASLPWVAFKEYGTAPVQLFDHWQEKTYNVGGDNEQTVLTPYGFHLLEPR